MLFILNFFLKFNILTLIHSYLKYVIKLLIMNLSYKN